MKRERESRRDCLWDSSYQTSSDTSSSKIYQNAAVISHHMKSKINDDAHIDVWRHHGFLGYT